MKQYKITFLPVSSQRIINYSLLTLIACLLSWAITLTGCTQQNNPQNKSGANFAKPNVINIGHQKGTPGL